jgi:chloramphenicol 3-O-phosphotransferase
MQRQMLGIFFIFIGMLYFCQCGGITGGPGVIVINGSSCSGKTSIAQACVELLNSVDVSLISVDKIKLKRSEDFDCRDRLHVATIKKIKSELKQGKFVVCDTVLDEQRWVNLFKQKLAGIKLYFVFVHCPLNILSQRLHERNRQARDTGDLINCRNFSQVLVSFGRMYDRVSSDTGIGTFTAQDFDFVRNKGCGPQVSKYDWEALIRRFDVFDYRAGDSSHFLKIKLDQDFVVYNYQLDQGLPKDEFIGTLAEQVMGAFSSFGKIII